MTSRFVTVVPAACLVAVAVGIARQSPVTGVVSNVATPAGREVVLRAPNATHRIVHVLNVHFVDQASFLADVADAEGRSLSDGEGDERYAAFLADLEAFQREQNDLLESVVCEFSANQVFLEGWTVEDAGIYRLIAETLWRSGDSADEPEAGDEPLRLRRMEFGVAARLWAIGRIGGIEPAESQALLEAASPFDAEGNFRGLFANANEEREDFMVQRLLAGGPTSVIVLGGAHDLSDNIQRIAGHTCEYVRVRSRGYDEMCRRYGLE